MGEFSAHQHKEGKTQELACRLHLLPPMPPGPEISHADLLLLSCPALYRDTPLKIKMRCEIQHRSNRKKDAGLQSRLFAYLLHVDASSSACLPTAGPIANVGMSEESSVIIRLLHLDTNLAG